jgi:PAS domain-containing protein
MTTITRKTPREFGQEVEYLRESGRWSPQEYRRLRSEVVELYGRNAGILDALAAETDPEWRDQVIAIFLNP